MAQHPPLDEEASDEDTLRRCMPGEDDEDNSTPLVDFAPRKFISTTHMRCTAEHGRAVAKSGVAGMMQPMPGAATSV
jgi:hypothetical protein